MSIEKKILTLIGISFFMMFGLLVRQFALYSEPVEVVETKSGTYETTHIIDNITYKLVVEYDQESMTIDYTCFRKEIQSDKYFKVIEEFDKCSSSSEMKDMVNQKIKNGDKI
jgi:hypothetical protein